MEESLIKNKVSGKGEVMSYSERLYIVLITILQIFERKALFI